LYFIRRQVLFKNMDSDYFFKEDAVEQAVGKSKETSKELASSGKKTAIALM